MIEVKSWEDTLSKKLILPVLILWGILALIFGMLDLVISKTFVDFQSGWGQFGADYGQANEYGMYAVGLAILLGSRFKDLSKQKLPAIISLIIGTCYFIISLSIKDYHDASYGLGVIIALILYLILMKNRDCKDFLEFGLVILFLAVIMTVYVSGLKTLCGRVRYRDLIAQGSFNNYTPWFLPPGPSATNHSFPSGHTRASLMVLPLLLLVKDKELNDPIRIITTVFSIAWPCFVAASRVVIGAHYASDVLFSIGMASITMIFLYWFFYFKLSARKS